MRTAFAVLALACGYVLAADEQPETIKIEITAKEEKPAPEKTPKLEPVLVTVWDAAQGAYVQLAQAVNGRRRSFEQVPFTAQDRAKASDGLEVLVKMQQHKAAVAEYQIWRDSPKWGAY